MGVFSTLVMDIGEETVKALFPMQESMKPQYLGRWILNMFDGVFIHDSIQCVFRVLSNTDSGTNLTAIPVLS